jgi:DNA helicase HerA-like ATPase
VEQFRSCKLDSEKLVCLDEAHKYLEEKSSALSRTLVDIVRQMRHLGMRIAISTQSPLVIPGEMLELVSVAIVHRFFSRDWFHHLKRKIPLDDAAFACITKLEPGEALVFAPSALLDEEDYAKEMGQLITKIRIRPRLTMDGGRSRLC